jgi:uncharacterized membrane protein (DUF4010 family)
MSPVITTQLTGIFCKLCQAIGILAFIAGAVGFYMGSQGQDRALQVPTMIALVLGPPVWAFGKIGGWCFHK